MATDEPPTYDGPAVARRTPDAGTVAGWGPRTGRRSDRLRWGDRAPGDVDEARQRILDAASRCFETIGMARTRVEDIASEANVSRATVYRYFRDRDALVLGVLADLADDFLLEVGARLAPGAPFDRQLVEGVAFAVRTVHEDDRLALLFTPETAGLTTSLPGAWELLFDRARVFLSPLLDGWRERGELRDDVEVDDVVEWILRVVLSLLAVPTAVERDEDRLRRFLDTFLVPSLRPAGRPHAGEGAGSTRSGTRGRRRGGNPA